MQTDPTALVHASCLSLSLEPSDVASQTSRPMRSLTDEGMRPHTWNRRGGTRSVDLLTLQSDSRTLKVTYPNLSSKVAKTSASISIWEHATPTIPSTPRRHGPNIGKRRGYTPDLSRSAKSSSHSTKMAKIFQEASAGLQNTTTTPSRNMSANTRRSRLPLSRHADRAPLNMTPIGADSIFSPQRLGVPSEVRLKPTLQTIAAATPPAIPYDQVFPTPMPHIDTPCGAKCVDCGNWDPPSSGFAEPAALTNEALNSGSDSDTRSRDFPSSPPVVGVDVDDGECHSSHGVPLIIPVPHLEPNETNKFFIEAWLNDVSDSSPVPDASTTCEPQLPCSGGDDQEDLHYIPVMPQAYSFKEAAISPLNESRRAPSRASSDKENVHPLSSSLAGPPPTLTPLPLSSPTAFLSSALCPVETPSRTKISITSSSASRFQQLHTPRGLFAVAPTRRKKNQPAALEDGNGTMTDKSTRLIENRISSALSQGSKTPSKSAFVDIHEDPVEPDEVQLSPAVTCFRKGRGPKRAKARCASYYDTDILGENTSPVSRRGDMVTGKRKMGKERRVLGTHGESEELCTPEAFVEEAEGAEFEYRV